MMNVLVSVPKDPLVLMLLFLLTQAFYMFKDLFQISVSQLHCWRIHPSVTLVWVKKKSGKILILKLWVCTYVCTFWGRGVWFLAGSDCPGPDCYWCTLVRLALSLKRCVRCNRAAVTLFDEQMIILLRTGILTKTKRKLWVGEERVLTTQFSRTVTTQRCPCSGGSALPPAWTLAGLVLPSTAQTLQATGERKFRLLLLK